MGCRNYCFCCIPFVAAVVIAVFGASTYSLCDEEIHRPIDLCVSLCMESICKTDMDS